MRQVAKKGLITLVATGGVLAVTGGYAYADAGASGTAAHSPGVLSGNTVQVPVNVPVNVCGNTVDAVGALNPTFGNRCANVSGHGGREHEGRDRRGDDRRGDDRGGDDPGGREHGRHHGRGFEGGSTARGRSIGSPGIGSGNTLQAPIDVPVNVCGNTVDAPGALNPAFGNTCVNSEAPRHHTEPRHHCPPPPRRHCPPHQEHHGQEPPHHEHHGHHRPPETSNPPELAHTGADSLGFTIPASAAMLLGGTVLYRRARAARR